MFCRQCGVDVGTSAFCKSCGTSISVTQGQQQNKQQGTDPNMNPNMQGERKSRLAAGLLGIFLGGLGIHNFYLGFTSRGMIQLLMTVIGWILIIPMIAAGIWGLIEGIMILAGSIKTDARGMPLTDNI